MRTVVVVAPAAASIWQRNATVEASHSGPPNGALRGALTEYRLLAISALAVQAAVWIDKVVVWISRGAAEASTLASATALAWFTVVPAFAWIYVQVETVFYQRSADRHISIFELRHGPSQST